MEASWRRNKTTGGVIGVSRRCHESVKMRHNDVMDVSKRRHGCNMDSLWKRHGGIVKDISGVTLSFGGVIEETLKCHEDVMMAS